MAASLTPVLNSGPACLGGMKFATYTITPDTGYPTGGYTIDFTNEFTTIDAIIPGGNLTMAGNGVRIGFVKPAPGTAISSSTVLMAAHWSADGTDGESLIEFTNAASLVAITTAVDVLVVGQ